MPKPSLKNSSGIIQPILRDKRVHAFPRGISTIMNIIAQLEFELTYHDVADKHISHHVKRISPHYVYFIIIISVLSETINVYGEGKYMLLN